MIRTVVTRHGHKISNKRGLVALHRLILWDKLGGENAPCHWCKRDLVWRVSQRGADTMCADHVDGDQTNNKPDNLVPSCRGCNGNRTRAKKPRECAYPPCDKTFLPGRPETMHCNRFHAQWNRGHWCGRKGKKNCRECGGFRP